MKIFQLAIVLYFAILHITSATAITELVCNENPERPGIIYAVDLAVGNTNVEDYYTQGDFKVELFKDLVEPGVPPALCSAQGVLKVTFPNVGIQESRLKLKMYMDVNTISGHSFHVGDAQDNNGGGGASSSYSAEVLSQGNDWLVNARVHVVGNQYRYNKIDNAISLSEVTVTLGDEYIRFEPDISGSIESAVYGGGYFYGLRGQDDYEVFIGLNRLISATGVPFPFGTGLCRIEITALTCEECQVRPLTKE